MQGVELSPIHGAAQNNANGNGKATSNGHTNSSDEDSPIKSTHLHPYLAHLSSIRSLLPDQPDVLITYRSLSYILQLQRSDSSSSKVLNLATHLVAGAQRLMQRKAQTYTLKALSEADGCIRPGKMTLLLAAPGHGKTTLLKALSGRLSHDSRLSGQVLYNGRSDGELRDTGVDVRRLCAYVSQRDLHFPSLTVGETFEFATQNSIPDARLLLESKTGQDPKRRAEIEKVISADEQRASMLISLLGLGECTETVIGNDLLRGISGGQRKRVTVGEMLCTAARAYFLDEVSTGLDAAVTLHIFSSLKQLCGLTNSTIVTALLQPTPEVYALFDDVILLQEGRVVYHGPRHGVGDWLWDVCGVDVPPGVDEAGFLVDFLTDPEQQYKLRERRLAEQEAGEHEEESLEKADVNGAAAGVGDVSAAPAPPLPSTPRAEGEASVVRFHIGADAEEPQSKTESNPKDGMARPMKKALAPSGFSSAAEYHAASQQRDIPPASPVHGVEELTERYRLSKWYKSLCMDRDLEMEQSTPLEPSKWSPYTRAAYSTGNAHSFWHHMGLTLHRQARLMVRNRTMVIPRLFQSCLMGFIFGTVFIQLPVTDFTNKMGLLLYVIMFGGFANMSELPIAHEAKGVVTKQIEAGFFPTIAYSLSVAICNVPLTILEACIFGTLIYWIPGLTPDAGRFFFFLLVFLLSGNAMSVFFRCISYIAKNPDVARQMDIPFILTFIIFGGFLITYDKIPDWLIWVFYISPFSWGVRSMALNEFDAPRYDPPVPSAGNIREGEYYMQQFGIQTEWIWKWMGVVYLVGWFFVFLMLNAILLAHTKPDTPIGTKLHVEGKQKKQKGKKYDQEARAIQNGARAHGETSGGAAATTAMEGVGQVVVTVDSGAAQEDSDPEPSPTSSKQNENGNVNVNGSAPVPAPASTLSLPRSKFLRSHASSFQLTALPFTPVTLTWKNIDYWVEVGSGKEKHERQLLKDISGFAAPGRMTALMGSSGAGKTTLLDCIAGRKTVGRLQGSILVNGRPKETHSFARLTGYVEQSDIHIGTATVREALQFSAHLRLPKSVSETQRNLFVEEVMRVVGLNKIANRLIGDASVPGLSPGQLKLVTIAVELVANPAVIFLDEPTSGLDAPSAARVMRAVRRIAATGRTVLCTIHQPSEELFLMFDRLLLLKSGGDVVYFGDLGRRARLLVHYFEAASNGTERLPRSERKLNPDGSYSYIIRQRINPANWMLDVIGAAGQAKDASKPEFDYPRIWRQSELCKVNTGEIEEASKPLQDDASAHVGAATDYLSSRDRLKAVVKRAFISHWRNAPMNLTRFFLLFLVGLLLGIVYYQMPHDDFGGVNSYISVMFLALAFPASLCAGSALPTLFRQRAVFYRETSIGLYGNKTFQASIFLVEFPYLVISLFFFFACFYPMVGFESSFVHFARFYCMSLLMALCYSSMSQLWLALFPNMIVANIANGIFLSLFFVMGGLFIKPSAIPRGWKWFFYINPVPKAFSPIATDQLYCVGPDCPTMDAGTGTQVDIYSWVTDRLEATVDDFGPFAGWLILEIVVLRIFIGIAMAKISHIKR